MHGCWLQIIRIVRLVRFITLLNRLYATAMAASAIILPGVTVSHNHAHFFNLLFGGAMLLNFLSCLWCAFGTADSCLPSPSSQQAVTALFGNVVPVLPLLHKASNKAQQHEICWLHPGCEVLSCQWNMHRCLGCCAAFVLAAVLRGAQADRRVRCLKQPCLLAELWPLLWQELRRHPGGHGEHLVRGAAPAAVFETECSCVTQNRAWLGSLRTINAAVEADGTLNVIFCALACSSRSAPEAVQC